MTQNLLRINEFSRVKFNQNGLFVNLNRSADLLTILDLKNKMSEVKSWWDGLGKELQLDLEEIEE